MKMALPIMLLTAVLMTGCNRPKHVSGAKFAGEVQLGARQTMVQSEYLGERDGKVYLSRKTMSLLNQEKWNETIWYTETSELDPDFLEQLRKHHKASAPTR